MTEEEIEVIYEALAQKIDEVGPENSEMYLAKLALLLSKEVGNLPAVMTSIAGAAQSINTTD